MSTGCVKETFLILCRGSTIRGAYKIILPLWITSLCAAKESEQIVRGHSQYCMDTKWIGVCRCTHVTTL
jgi:hypothetical protein